MEHRILYCRVRVLDAACFAPPVKVLVGNRCLADELEYGAASAYQRVSEGFRRVSVIGVESGEEITAQILPFYGGRDLTLVICNTMDRVALIPMEEPVCAGGKHRGCLRLANFSFDDGPFDVVSKEGEPVFSSVLPREITRFLPAVVGDYEYLISCAGDSGRLEGEGLDFFVRVLPGKQYTACILGARESEQPLQVKILEF